MKFFVHCAYGADETKEPEQPCMSQLFMELACLVSMAMAISQLNLDGEGRH
jgi:hypothetical protein